MFETNFMPFVITDSIILGRDSIRAKCFIRSRQAGEMPFWLEEDVISSYIKVIFFALYPPQVLIDPFENRPRSERNLPAISVESLYSSDTRVRNIFKKQVQQIARIEDWYTVITRNFPHKIMSLKEIRDYSQENITTTSVLDLDSENLSDMFFEFELDNMDIVISQNPADKGPSKIELIGFSYLDVKSLKEDFSNSFGYDTHAELLKKVGNLSYSLVMDTDDSGNRFIPNTKMILTTADGTPYIGDYHYHNGNGPGGYTGYMAGPKGHPNMASMPRLYKREVPNNKIVASHFMSEPPETGYYGASTMASEDENGDLQISRYPSSAEYRTSKLSMGELDASLRVGTNLFIKKFYEDPKNHSTRSVIDQERNKSWIKAPVPGSSTYGYHSTKFSIDFDKLLRTNSKFGFFLNLIRKSGTVTIGGNEINYKSIMNDCRIAGLSVYRKRLANHPAENSPVGSRTYGAFDTDEIPQHMGTTSDAPGRIFYKSLRYTVEPEPLWLTNQKKRDPDSVFGIAPQLDRRTERPRSSIHEIPIESVVATKMLRHFEIRDYEMYRDINFGLYTYEIAITFEDNIKKTILSIVTQFQKLIKEYGKFLYHASRPFDAAAHNRGKNSYYGASKKYFSGALGIEVEEQNTSRPELDLGSYDVVRRKYTQSFKTYATANYNDKIIELVDYYVAMRKLLTGLNISRENILNAILPSSNGELEEAQAFETSCNNVMSLFIQMLARDNKQASPIGFASNNVSINGTSDYQYSLLESSPSNRDPDIIYIKEELDVVVSAFRGGTVMASYDVEEEYVNILRFLREDRQRRMQLEQEEEELEETEGESLPRDLLGSLVSKIITNTVDTRTSTAAAAALLSKTKDYKSLQEALVNQGPGSITGLTSGARSFISAESLLASPAELMEAEMIPVSLRPTSLMTSFGKESKDILNHADYKSLPPDKKAINNAFAQQIIKSDPSKTESQIKNKNISLSEMPVNSGTSIGVPSKGVTTTGLGKSNKPTVKNDDIKSSAISKFVEESISAAGIKKDIANETSFEKQKVMKAEEDSEIFSKTATSTSLDKKATVVAKVLAIASAVNTVDNSPKTANTKLDKIKDVKSTTATIDSSLGTKTAVKDKSVSDAYDIFDKKVATVEVTAGMITSEAKDMNKGNSYYTNSGTGAESRINMIEDVIEITATPDKKDDNIIAVNNVAHIPVKSTLTTIGSNPITVSAVQAKYSSQTNVTNSNVSAVTSGTPFTGGKY